MSHTLFRIAGRNELFRTELYPPDRTAGSACEGCCFHDEVRSCAPIPCSGGTVRIVPPAAAKRAEILEAAGELLIPTILD